MYGMQTKTAVALRLTTLPLMVVAVTILDGRSALTTEQFGITGTTHVIAEKIQFAAQPFSLSDVRLLDSPFRDAMLRDERFLLELDPDRLLHNFRVNAELSSAARPLGGWEAPDVELRGHSVGHYLSAIALMYAVTGDARFKQRGDFIVGELAKVQEAMPARGYNEGYLSAFPEEFIDRVEKRERVWAPYYTLHKIMAGLLDTYELTGNRQALDVLLQQTNWVKLRMDRLTHDQRQAMLMTEYGGMNEVLANLYAVTGNSDHLELARAFDHDFLFDPLSRGEDTLDGLHANTQIPKMIGAAREYELTGEARYRDIATFFWDRVALHRSYANGGHSDDESFFPVNQFSHHLGTSSSETCNTYNMLKLTRHLFSWHPSAQLMDFYERGLYNHILASQDPSTGMMIYYCPLKPGAWKSYSTSEDSFWCCVGTGMENHSKYADTIYFHDDRALYVNLYIPSELRWKEKGLVVRQETGFPESDSTRLSFTAERPASLDLKVRQPFWAASGMTITVNGKTRTYPPSAAGDYVTITGSWKTGDTVDIRLPMSLRLEAMPDDPNVVAMMYGPVLLAGDLGTEGLAEIKRYGPSAPPVGRAKTPVVPIFVIDRAGLLEHVTPLTGTPLTFRTKGVGQPNDVTLIPFYKASNVRYTVYWNVYSVAEWKRRKTELTAIESRHRDIQTHTLDFVDLGNAESERAHAYGSANADQTFFEGRAGREARNGWFSYEFAVPGDKLVALVCTYRGGEGRGRVFDIFVDGQKVATETLPYHPTELLDIEYAIPEELTKGKQRLTVKFEPHTDAATAAVFEIRIVPRARAKQ
jgi:DUF1680 family protein